MVNSAISHDGDEYDEINNKRNIIFIIIATVRVAKIILSESGNRSSSRMSSESSVFCKYY